MATKAANKRTLNYRRNQVMDSVKNVNGMVLDLTENIIEETLATGAKYQKVAASAIRKSEPIIEKQVDMIFDSVELAIDQFQNNSKRLQKLLGITKQVKSAKNQIGKIVNVVSKKVEDSVEDAEKVIKKTRRKATPKKVVKAVKAEVKRTRKTVSKKANSTARRAKKTVRRATTKK